MNGSTAAVALIFITYSAVIGVSVVTSSDAAPSKALYGNHETQDLACESGRFNAPTYKLGDKAEFQLCVNSEGKIVPVSVTDEQVTVK